MRGRVEATGGFLLLVAWLNYLDRSLLVPLALILPHFFGVMGIYYAEPVSDIISAATATVLFSLNINRILSREYLAKIE